MCQCKKIAYRIAAIEKKFSSAKCVAVKLVCMFIGNWCVFICKINVIVPKRDKKSVEKKRGGTPVNSQGLDERYK